MTTACDLCSRRRPEGFPGCKRDGCPILAGHAEQDVVAEHGALEGHRVEWDPTDESFYCWACSWGHRP